MALVFHSGFETSDFSEWPSITGTCAVVNTIKKTGSYAVRCNPSPGSGGVITNIYYTQWTFYLYIASLPDSDCSILGYTAEAHIKLTTAGELDVYWGATKKADGSTQLSEGSWYRISVSIEKTTDTGNVWINGNLEHDGVDNVGVVGYEILGVIGPVTADLYFDDVACGDAEDLTDLGDIRVAAASPNLAGTYAQYDTSSGYGNVDEIPANDADFIEDEGADVARESYNIANLTDLAGASSGDTVNAVSLWIRGDRDGGGATDHKAMVRDNGSDYESSDLDFDSIAWFNWYLAIMPDDSAAWSEARFNSLEIGAYHSGAQDQRVHCLVAMVAYTPSVAPPVRIPRYAFVNFQDPGIV